MYYSDEIIEEVRSRNDIVDVVSGYIKMTKKGGNYWGLCPFHNEHTPSFSVNGNKQIFHCFGCGEGGNVLSFVMKYENLTFQDAVKLLAERGGVTLPEVAQSPADKERANKRKLLLDANKDAATYFYQVLRTPHGERGMKYLSDRKLTAETMNHFGLGFAGIDGRGVVEYLRKKGYSDDIIRDCGIATFNEKRGLSSQFWNRVMFPIFDASSRVIGFGGRVMGDGEPKYLNSPETEIFDKRRNLYGYNYARKNKSGYIILCEGYMDVIAMHQAGFTEASASLGTAFTQEQAMLLKRSFTKIYLAYDSDGAGVKAALRAIEILRSTGLSGRVINMRPYKDPDEFIKNLGADEFRKRIDEAELGIFFDIRILAENTDMRDPESRTEFQRQIAQKLVTYYPEKAERDNYLEAIAEKYNIQSQNLQNMVIKSAENAAGVVITKPKSGIVKESSGDKTQANFQKAQGMLLTYLTDDPKLYPKLKRYIKPEDFTEGIYFKVAARLFADFEDDKYNPASIVGMSEDDEEQRLIASIFETRLDMDVSDQDLQKSIKDIIITIKKSSLDHFTNTAESGIQTMQEIMKRKKEIEDLSKLHSLY